VVEIVIVTVLMLFGFLAMHSDSFAIRMAQFLAPVKRLVFQADGRGMMNFRLWGLLPTARAQGADIDKSALGGLATEATWVPSCLLPQRGARAEFETSDGRAHPATLFRLGTCFGRGLLVFPAGSAQLSKGEQFWLKFPQEK
jgi:hypothetical protein